MQGLPSKLLALGGALAALGVFALWRGVHASTTADFDRRAEARGESPVEGQDRATPARSSDGTRAIPVVTGPSSRASVSAALVGRVVAAGGAGIPGAQVSLVESGTESSSARTDADGRFDLGPVSAHGVLVVSHLRHQVAAVEVLPEAAEQTVVLTPSDPVEVHVTSASRPVERARVESTARFRIGGTDVPYAWAAETDVDGRALVPWVPPRSTLVASDGQRRSEEWVGRHVEVARAVELSLEETFTLRGRVRGAPSTSALSDAHVTIRRGVDEDLWDRGPHAWRRALARTDVEPDGTWATTTVPWKGPGLYVCRLEAPGSVPQERPLELTSPTDAPLVDFDWTAGPVVKFHVWSLVEDEPIPDAEVLALWKDGDRWVRTSGRTQADGTLLLSLPQVTFYNRVHAEGFANHAEGPGVPEEGREILIQLHRPARVTGRCLADGAPVRDFEVTYWGANATDRQTLAFEGREDGTFEILDAPPDLVHVRAASADRPPSAIATLSPAVGESVSVDLDLPTSAPAQGRVLEARTGEPIPSVVIQVRPVGRERLFEPWGPEFSCRADGSFGPIPVPPSDAALMFRAHGYADNVQNLPRPNGEGAFDYGVVTLQKTQRLTVQLRGVDVIDYSDFSGELYAAGVVAKSAADGLLVFEDVEPGSYYFLVYGQNGRRQDARFVLEPGADWKFEISVDTGRTLRITVHPEEGQTLPEGLWARVTYQGVQRAPTKGQQALQDGTTEMEFVSGSRALVEIIDNPGTLYASGWFDLPDRDGVDVELNLGGRDVELLCQYADGSPIVEPFVTLTAPDDRFGLDLLIPGDEQGRVVLRGWTANAAYVQVIAQFTSITPRFLVDLGPEQALPVVLKVHLDHGLRLRFEERGQPMPAIPVAVTESGDWEPRLHLSSGTDGTLEIDSLDPGSYDVRVEGGGCWPILRSFDSALEPASQIFEVRRIGGATLRFVREGLPVSGLMVTVRSHEWQASVDEWVAQGLASTGPQGFVTDQHGEITLQGVPNGQYRWEAGGGSGDFGVLPWGSAAVTCSLP